MPFTRRVRVAAAVDLPQLADVVDLRVSFEGVASQQCVEQSVKYRCTLGETIHLKVTSTVTKSHRYSSVPRRDSTSADGSRWVHRGTTTERPKWTSVVASLAERADCTRLRDVPQVEVKVEVRGAAPFEKLVVGKRDYPLDHLAVAKGRS